MSELNIEPSYVGKNEMLKFIVPKELFELNISPEEKIDRATARKFSKYIRGTFKGFQNARKTKYNNEENKKIDTTPEFWVEFEKKAKSMGVDLIGYTPIQQDFVFFGLKVYGKNAIVLGMEMKWEEIKKAPSVLTEVECFRVYSELGDIIIELTEYFKEKGYKSEAHHPFGGKMLFGPHAVSAGLGIVGKNGLIITPEFGPRQRWGIISTDAHIPETSRNPIETLKDYCEKCKTCIKGCKGGATLENPIEKGNRLVTRIDRSKCILSILKNNYCSVCLKICPFSNPDNKLISR